MRLPLIGIVITSEIANEELLYGKGICKNPEGYTWNEIYDYTTTIRQISYYEIKLLPLLLKWIPTGRKNWKMQGISWIGF